MKSAQTAVVTPTLTQRWKAIRPLVIVLFFSLSVMIATALIPRNEADYSPSHRRIQVIREAKLLQMPCVITG